jgi:hypothetical protein
MPCCLRILLLLALATPIGAQTPLPLPTKLRDTTLALILNEGSVTDVSKELGPDSGNLLLRLYSVAVEGTCVPATHWVCSSRYWLAASAADEMPEETVYYLGEYGELTDFRPGPPAAWNGASFHATAHAYPGHALKQNPKLTDARSDILFSVGLDTIYVVGAPLGP